MPVADPVNITEEPVTATVTVAERAPNVLGRNFRVIEHMPLGGSAAVHVFEETSISALDGVTVGTVLERSPVFVIVYVMPVLSWLTSTLPKLLEAVLCESVAGF